MDEFIINFVDTLGLAGIAILMALENVFPPMPSEAVMGAAALAIYHGRMDFWPVLIAGTTGTVVGNFFWYWIGHKWGYERLQPFIDRWGHFLTVEWEDVEHASQFFRRHGHWVVLGLRTTPFMRTLISLPAGLTHMNFWKFTLFTTIGAAAWNAILILGTKWLIQRFPNSENIVSWILIGIVVSAVIAYIWRYLTWKPRAQR
jgi:membrane protein DedA with SNARE-associated domain